VSVENEVIHNRTTIHLDWKDRLRALWGKPIHSEVDIEVAQPEVVVVRSTSRVWVERIVPPRQKGGYAIMQTKGTQDRG
jgi:hypothetical protein